MSDIKVIIDELSRTLSGIDRKQQEQMADEILKAKHIFVAGADNMCLFRKFGEEILQGFQCNM